MTGEIHDERSLFLRVSCGTAKNAETGITYELNTAPCGSPVIMSDKTGKYWTVSWNELIGMAIESGIDWESR